MKEEKKLLEKTNSDYVVIGLFVIAFLYYMFGSDPTNPGIAEDRVTTDIQQTRQQLDSAGKGITDSQRTADQIGESNIHIRETVNNLRQSNSITKNAIDENIRINLSSHDLIRRGQQILQDLPTAEK